MSQLINEEVPNNYANKMAEIKISYSYLVSPKSLLGVSSSVDTFDYLRAIWSPQIDRLEEFMILCLNRANKILGYSKIGQGGFSGTVADPKVIFQVSLKANASSIILAHNHPSGNLKPSANDIQLTRKIQKAGEYLDLLVLDHIILSSDGYLSFADTGLI